MREADSRGMMFTTGVRNSRKQHAAGRSGSSLRKNQAAPARETMTAAQRITDTTPGWMSYMTCRRQGKIICRRYRTTKYGAAMESDRFIFSKKFARGRTEERRRR
jgi:hypothetical protein